MMRTTINAIDRYATSHKLTCAIRKDELAPCTCGLIAALRNNEAMKDLIEKAQKMREAQEKYYKGGRLTSDLRTAKSWEREFDKAMALYLGKDQPADTTQERLL